MRRVCVELPDRPYDILIDRGLLWRVGPLAMEAAGGRSAFIITDTNVGPLYAEATAKGLADAGYATFVVSFPAGEPNKTLATVSCLFDQIFAAPTPPDRESVVVGLGGGVVGDVAGFVAATLLRGVALVQVPTSLLADVDSSVGGKTAVDHPAGKNLIGAFHQPRIVCIDTGVLATLDKLELSCGLAECVKHGVIRDESLVTWLDQNADALLGGDADRLTELIARNVAIKAAVVAEDERETGRRAHLNFGHTIGHAIEAVAGLTVGSAGEGDYLRHGHCVALGMVAADHIAVSRRLLPADQAERVERLLSRLNLPIRRAGLDGPELLRIMRHDKKARGGVLRFVLPAGSVGAVEIQDDVTEEEIFAAIGYLATG
ncbi:MAG: 3-dehydroquinate synthase [Planctomycetes bacterium]|nr:3-dehydroquinate synthase [Planctomycetota bacterium]